MKNPFRLILILNNHLNILGIGGILFLIKRILYRDKIIEIRVKGYLHPIFLRNNTSDITVFYQIFFEKSYAVDYRIAPKIIIDCGANIGLASIFYKIRFPNSVIYAIEPETSNFNLMLRNTEGSKNIICIKGGIWNKQTNLLIDNDISGNWGFKVNEVNYSNNNTVSGISIPYLMEQYRFDEIDVLKIDIEGSEKEMFESNFKSWLPKTKVLLIELHDGHRKGATKSFFQAINNYNYSMVRKNENLIFHFE